MPPFFNPLGAISSFGGGFTEGVSDARKDQLAAADLMGMQALGKAFQMPQVQGPIGGVAPIGPQPVARPPMPGQPSMPPPAPPPPASSGGPPPAGTQGLGGLPSTQAALAPPPAGGSPQAGGGPQPGLGGQPLMGGTGAGPGGSMVGQFDLQSLAARIAQANPNLPPQAMAAALLRAAPLLNIQGRQDLAQLSLQLRSEMAEQRIKEGQERIDLQRQLYGMGPSGGRQGGTSGQADTGQSRSNVQAIADGIEDGTQPPTLQGLYRQGPGVRGELAQRGFNLEKAQLEDLKAKTQIRSLNGPQMTRFVGLADSVQNTIDEVNRLAAEMDNIGVPAVNAVKLAAYIQTAGNTEGGQLAARYIGAVNTLKEEFANLANGGYAPTEPAWNLANQQINGNYGVKELGASLKEIKRLINYRLKGIPNIGTMGPGSPNRYMGGGQQQGGIMPGGEQIIGGGSSDPLGIR